MKHSDNKKEVSTRFGDLINAFVCLNTVFFLGTIFAQHNGYVDVLDKTFSCVKTFV